VALDTPTYVTSRYGPVGVVDAAATHDEATGRAAVFLVNRGTTEPASVTIDASALDAGVGILEAVELSDTDPYAKNTLQKPDRVALRDAAADLSGGIVTLTLPPTSWTAVRLG
jgi:alpha-N-arabinofuranosidase